MRLLVLDFETYFSTDYSLKRLSTEEYVRDPRFQAHMLGYWLPGAMAQPADMLPAAIADNGAPIAGCAVLCHHAQFDGLILSHLYGIRPAFWFDTLAMARLVLPRLRSHALDALAEHFGLGRKSIRYDLFRDVRHLSPELYAEVAEGCRHDVFLNYEIFRRLLPHVPKDELRVIDATVRMFTEPCLRLDRPRLAAFLQVEKVRKAKAMLAAGDAIGLSFRPNGTDARTVRSDIDLLRQHLAAIEVELQSSAKFQTALESLGYPCPMKHSPKQDCPIPALAKSDDGMKELLEHEDHRVQALSAARLGVKSTIDETRAESLLAADARGALPVYLKYAAAKTLRFGGGDKTNWQNFRRGGEIRKSILAPAGMKLVIGDLSQIEYRLLCWLTGQSDKLEALTAGRDLYVEFASMLYGEEVAKSDKQRRTVGKVGVLQSGYGAGASSIQRQAANATPPTLLSDVQALRARDIYRETHPRVPQFWEWCGATLPVLAAGGVTSWRGTLRVDGQKVHLPNDTALDYTGLRWASNVDIFPDQPPDGEGYAWWEPTRRGWSRIWGSKLTADIVQALACAVIKDIWVRMLPERPALQVHDELVFAMPQDRADTFAETLEAEMTTPPAWCVDIPLAAEIIVSDRYEK